MTTLASAGTALLSLSFAFSVTCQEFLGSCIFLFIKHPYDVGDRIDVTDEKMVVEKISLLYTVLTRIDKMQVVQVCYCVFFFASPCGILSRGTTYYWIFSCGIISCGISLYMGLRYKFTTKC